MMDPVGTYLDPQGYTTKKHPKQSYCNNIWMDSFCYLNTRNRIQSSFLFLQHPCVVYIPTNWSHTNQPWKCYGKFIPKSSHGVAGLSYVIKLQDHKIHNKTRVFQLLGTRHLLMVQKSGRENHLAYIKSNCVTNRINYNMYLPTKKQDNVFFLGDYIPHIWFSTFFTVFQMFFCQKGLAHQRDGSGLERGQISFGNLVQLRPESWPMSSVHVIFPNP